MINELTILKKLEEVIETQLNSYIQTSEESDLLQPVSEKNVVIDFPDVDSMPMSNMIYIQPNQSSYDSLSVESDGSVFDVDVFIVCKRDKQENLTRKIYGYFNSLYSLMRNNTSLDGTVDFVDVTEAQFYPAVEANRNVQAVNAGLSVRYTKDF